MIAAQSCLTLWDPGSPIPWLLCPWNSPDKNIGVGSYSFSRPGDLPNPGIEPRFSALQADSLPSEPPGKPKALERLYGN